MNHSRDRIRLGPGADGIERLEAHLYGQAFSPHRHDTYAIGITISGIQTFRYRGQQWRCLPGQCHILHPDEIHDGSAGTEDGFGYRIVYIDPLLIQDALGGRPLPFVAQPVVDTARLPAGIGFEVWDIDAKIDDMARVELVIAVTNLLIGGKSDNQSKADSLALHSVKRVRDMIIACPAAQRSVGELERLADLDRWTLARQFRAAFGTSPSRFRTMRRLDNVRRLLRNGTSLAEAATAAGFSDQSHMSRQFKRAYGFTPARWMAALDRNCVG
jgi:AraC-like DNA-binding protein